MKSKSKSTAHKKTIVRIGMLVFAYLLPTNATGAETVTKVTTYIVKKQEQRRNLRFTLTEWLRIKERMKFMDLWLAMFSGPEKSEFSPELNFTYGLARGTHSGVIADAISGTGTREVKIDKESNPLTAQLWLTNLIHSQIGIRFLNIDLGLEGQYSTGRGTGWQDEGAAPGVSNPQFQRMAWMGNLRLFGKNIQDSSLVVKGGRYLSTDLQSQALSTTPTSTDYTYKHAGSIYGLGLQLYFFSWLGIEGNGHIYSGRTTDDRQEKLDGQQFDYSAFIEISLLRILFGKYQETWEGSGDSSPLDSTESGFMAALRLQI